MDIPVYYPVFLNLKGKRCIVAGGGRVAERKALSLASSGADVTVISPRITERLKIEKKAGNITHIRRGYKKGDLRNAFLVIAATSSMHLNKKISAESPHLVNVVDVPALCNFIVPSVVRRGPLTIAISTSGVSPSMAKAIRKELEKLYHEGFAKHLNELRKIRKKAMSEIKDRKKRERFLKKTAAAFLKKMRSPLK